MFAVFPCLHVHKRWCGCSIQPPPEGPTSAYKQNSSDMLLPLCSYPCSNQGCAPIDCTCNILQNIPNNILYSWVQQYQYILLYSLTIWIYGTKHCRVVFYVQTDCEEWNLSTKGQYIALVGPTIPIHFVDDNHCNIFIAQISIQHRYHNNTVVRIPGSNHFCPVPSNIYNACPKALRFCFSFFTSAWWNPRYWNEWYGHSHSAPSVVASKTFCELTTKRSPLLSNGFDGIHRKKYVTAVM